MTSSSSNNPGHEPIGGERAPLLGRSSSKATLSSTTSAKSASADTVHPNEIYVKVLESSLPWYRRPSPFWLLPAFVLTATTAGFLLAAYVPWQTQMLCREYLNRHSTNTTMQAGVEAFIALNKDAACSSPDIQSFTAKVLGLIEVLAAIASTLSVGYYTSMSDTHGRVKLIAFTFCSTILLLLCILTMNTFWDQIGLPLMFVSGVLNGAMGGIGLGSTMMLAYSADCTEPARRSLIFSWLHAALFLGLAIGPIFGGKIFDAFGIMPIAYIDLAVNITFLILTLTFLPESVPHLQSPEVQKLFREAKRKARREAGLEDSDTDEQSENEATAVGSGPRKQEKESVAWHTHAIRALQFFKPNGQNTNLILLAAISFLQTLALKGTLSVIVLYTQRKFNFDGGQIGVLFSLGNFMRLVTLIFVLPMLVFLFQRQDKKKKARQERNKQVQPDEDTVAATPFAKGQQGSLPTSATHATLYDDENDIMVAASVEQLGESILEQHFNKNDNQPASYTQPSTNAASRSHDHPRHTTADSTNSWSSNTTASPTSPTLTAAPNGGGNRDQQGAHSGLKFDTWMIRLGFTINSVTYLGYGLAWTGWVFYLASATHALSILSTPSLKSLLTMMVEPSQFGAVLGAIQVVDAIASIFSPVAVSWVYAVTVYKMPEFVWYSCSAWMAVCVVLSFLIRQKQFRQRSAV